MGDVLEATASAIAPPGTTRTWVDPTWLVKQGLNGMSLPLWTEGTAEWVMALDPGVAYATGLQPRPLEDTVRDTAAWSRGRDDVLRPEWGLATDREKELLNLWRS